MSVSPPESFLTYIDEAYEWLCSARLDYSANSDIWRFRFHWNLERENLLNALACSTFRFGVTTCYRFENADKRIVFAARDSLVLKMLALYLNDTLVPRLPRSIFHLKDRGGLTRISHKFLL